MNNKIYQLLNELEISISKCEAEIGQIEKDIILQQLRDLYLKTIKLNSNNGKKTTGKIEITVDTTTTSEFESQIQELPKPPKEENIKQQEVTGKNTEYQEVKVIGETLGKENLSLYDKLAKNDKQAITDIKSAIPIGERFLYIRELFGNNSEKFNLAIDKLNKCSDFNQAVNILIGEYLIDENNENLVTFLDIVRKKYL